MKRTRSRILMLLLLLSALLASFAVPAFGQGSEVAQDDGDAGEEEFSGQIRDAEREPVEGAEVVVTTDDGEEVGTGTSDDDGQWVVPVEGPGNYVVTLVEESLPEGVGLRDPDRASSELTLTTGQQRTVGFAIGEERAAEATALSRLPQNLLNGVRFGLIIAMTAIGLSLIFGTTRLINFAHGEMVTAGAVVAWFLNALGPQIPLVGAALLAAAFGGLLGAAMERGLWRPLRERRTGLIQMLVITIGLTLVIRHVVLIVFGGRSRSYLDFAVQAPITLGPIRATPRDLTVIALAILILLAVAFLLQKTRLGKAMRAVADNNDLAESSGIDVKRVILIVWVMGGGLAAMGGVFLGVVENVNYMMGFRLLLLMFAGVILGGLGTAFGAAVGSLAVGIVTEVSTIWLSSELKEMWALAALIVILLVRPQGILGIKERIG